MICVVIAKKSDLVGGRVKKCAPLLQKCAKNERDGEFSHALCDATASACFDAYMKNESSREARLLLSSSMLDYVMLASCEGVREERIAGYALLSSAIRLFYDSGCLKIRAKNGENTPNLRHILELDEEISENCGAFEADGKACRERTLTQLRDTFCENDLTLASDVFKIIRGEHGKPEFEMLDLHFNISHSGDAIAVMLSDECEVGVDVECGISPEKEKRLCERYFTELQKTRPLENASFYWFSNRDGRDMLIPIIPCSDESNELMQNEITINSDVDGNEKALNDDSDNRIVLRAPMQLGFKERWSVGEAIMKCDGGGFATYPDISALAERAYTKTLALSFGGVEYILTAAVEKK